MTEEVNEIRLMKYQDAADKNNEEIILLQVLAFVLFISCLMAIVTFINSSAIFIVVCVLGTLIGILGFFGASRRKNIMLKIFWISLAIWTAVILIYLFYTIFFSSSFVPEEEIDGESLRLNYSISSSLLAVLLIFFWWKIFTSQRNVSI